MGTTCFTPTPGKSTAELLIEEFRSLTFVDHAVVGSTLYAVVLTQKGEHFLIVVITSRSRGQFCYKEMEDTMGPAEKKCPQRILDLADRLAPLTDENDPHGSGRAWRRACRGGRAAPSMQLFGEA